MDFQFEAFQVLGVEVGDGVFQGDEFFVVEGEVLLWKLNELGKGQDGLVFSLHDAWHLVEENVDFFEDYEAEVILIDRVDLKVGREAGLDNASNVLQVGK